MVYFLHSERYRRDNVSVILIDKRMYTDQLGIYIILIHIYQDLKCFQAE